MTPMLNIPENIGSKYRFIVIAAQRATQLMLGAKPRVNNDDAKHTITAMQEVLAEQIKFEITETPHVPTRS